jgi:hypothetical protein
MLERMFAGVAVGLLAVVIFALLAIVGAIPMYLLWNWLMPTIFSLKVITFWQAWGLLWLSAIIFKSPSSK